MLLAPSRYALQVLLDEAFNEANKLNLLFNSQKSKYLVFRKGNSTNMSAGQINIVNVPLDQVNSFKYLGFILSSNLSNVEDICRTRNKFYLDFNSLLRKFPFTNYRVKLFLFRHFCLQFYGSEMWFHNDKGLTSLKHFSVGYHKAIKKILNLSYHESNHFACQEASLLTFDHYLNKISYTSARRLITKPCIFMYKVRDYLNVSSVFLSEVKEIFLKVYDIELLFEQDMDAVLSRISYVQNHENQMRGAIT